MYHMYHKYFPFLTWVFSPRPRPPDGEQPTNPPCLTAAEERRAAHIEDLEHKLAQLGDFEEGIGNYFSIPRRSERASVYCQALRELLEEEINDV